MGPPGSTTSSDVWSWIRTCALGARGIPNARAEAGGPTTGPGAAAPNRAKLAGPTGGARASDGIHLSVTRGRNAATQPDRIESEKPTGRKNAAAVYAEVNLDGSAMAPRRGGDHAPVSIELGRNCRQNRANDGGKGRKADGARAMANHE